MDPIADRIRKEAGPDDLTGSLQTATLIDLCQFFLLNRKSGRLTLYREGGTATVFFSNGEIINAVDDREGLEGREVALKLFRLREGGFLFRQEEVHEKRRIEGTTENLLLDAARKMDEIGEALPSADGPKPSQEKDLLEKQEKGKEFRALFASLEEDLTRVEEEGELHTILSAAESAGADGVLSREGRAPALLLGSRHLRDLPGEGKAEEIESIRRALRNREEILFGNGAWRVIDEPEQGRLLFRRRGRNASLGDVNLSPPVVEALFHHQPGPLFLVGEAEPTRRFIFDGLLRHLDQRGEMVIIVGEERREEGKGIFLSHPALDGDGEESRALDRLLRSNRSAKVALPELENSGEARRILDLARRGHTVITTLPGREGGEALRRAASWFSEEGSLRALASLLTGVVSLQLHPGKGKHVLPVTSVAPWTDEARRALEREEYTALSAALERAAGENGLVRSFERLLEAGRIEKSEAERIASLIRSIVGSGVPAGESPVRV